MFVSRRTLLITAVATVLIPILLAMTPLGLILRCGSSNSKDLHVRTGIPLLFHSISVTQDDDTSILGFISISRTKELKVLLHFPVLKPGFVLSNALSNSVPLRC
jgi:hypothetical protein